jgi:tripartite-type tricarboxylate transporter receptor subunit TctC
MLIPADTERASARRSSSVSISYTLAILALLGYVNGIAAQDYPNKPVRVLVPTPAGSTSDTVARLIAPGLAGRLGQQFIVDNRSGAVGMLGTELAAKATPDGHTLLLGTPAALTIIHYTQKDVPYETLKDFTPIGLISVGPYLFVAHSALPVKTVAEFIALAKAEPGKLTYGSSGNGRTSHLAMELFKSMAGVDIRHIPYKGTPQATSDLIGGRVNVSMLSIGPLLAHVKAQRLRVLAVTSGKRSQQLPLVPTVDESGLKGFEVITWFGMLAPAKTPPEVVQSLSQALQQVIRPTEMRAQFQRQGAEPASGEPAEFAALIRREMEIYARLAKISGIKMD